MSYTPTAKILAKMERTKNPVTRSVYRDIIGARIDRLIDFEAEQRKENKKFDDAQERTHLFMQSLTYSFESRSKMEAYFKSQRKEKK